MPDTLSKGASDGGRTSYYDLPASATTLAYLIEYRRMSFNVGNIFKASWRIGLKEGVTDVYDLNKIIYFAQRELAVIAARQAKYDNDFLNAK